MKCLASFGFSRFDSPYIYCIFCLLVATSALLSSRAFADTVDCDVLVVGGGSAGVVAAIQSGRAGAKTILVEVSCCLGGNTTVGGVNSPESFFREGKQRIAGIGWEWCQKTAALDDGILPDSKKHYRINPALLAMVAEELCGEAGVQIRYYESPLEVKKGLANGPAGTAFHWLVTTAAMGETRTIRAKVLVDCTGNGALAALAGAERMREKEIMAGSFTYKIEHQINLDKLGRAEYRRLCEKALAEGRLREGDARHGWEGLLTYQAGNYIYDADNSTSQARTDTNIRGRQMVLRVLRFLRTLPGGETARLVSAFPEVGVRETWRVKGEYVVTGEDYLHGRKWDDSICYACYQIDLHKPRWDDFVRIPLAPGIQPTVPLRALVAKDVDFLLMAGRCLSSDREALSALRIQAACMATGQAAGATAALAAQENTTPKKIDPAKVKVLLKRHGALVPE